MFASAIHGATQGADAGSGRSEGTGSNDVSGCAAFSTVGNAHINTKRNKRISVEMSICGKLYPAAFFPARSLCLELRGLQSCGHRFIFGPSEEGRVLP